MKRIAVTLFTTLSLFGLFASHSVAEETTESSHTTPSTTEPSSETPPSEDLATITFIYIDVDTNSEIATSKSVTDKLGTTISVEIKNIPGYQVSDVMLVREVDILSTDYSFPIRYVKDPTTSSTASASNVQGPAETTPSTPIATVEEPTSTSTQPTQHTVEGDIENNTANVITTSDSTANTSSSNTKKTIGTSNTSSEATSLSSKEKKLAATKKTAGFLPKAGTTSNSISITIGLLTIFASLAAYWFLKKKIT